MFQSTRPRGARRDTIERFKDSLEVSIHAPARGATGAAELDWHAETFQSTRPRGARPFLTRRGGRVKKFQSTRPRGARRQEKKRIHQEKNVSIHAPARGATMYSFTYTPLSPWFQSTRPRGARHALSPLLTAYRRFNPRAREGRDHSERDRKAAWMEFQSTRPRGARPDRAAAKMLENTFQSTRPRGARHENLGDKPGILQFQSTRPRGARRCCNRYNAIGTRSFNPRAREGRDRAAQYIT